MLRSLFRLFFSSIYLTYRQNVKVYKNEVKHAYQQTYRVVQHGAEYSIQITETSFTIDYKLFFMPKIKRVLYTAELKYTVNGEVVDTFTQSYPRLTLGGGLDPLYPLAVVADTHLDIYLSMEKSHEAPLR